MSKSQIIIVIIAIIAVIFLFTLPKFIVKDSRSTKSGGPITSATPMGGEKEPDAHSGELSTKDMQEINNLRKAYLSVSDKGKKINFADSLAVLFKGLNKYDSSAKYIGEIAALESSFNSIEKAGDAYFEASTFSIDPAKAQKLSLEARGYFEKAQELQPENLEVKTKVAKTFLGTEDPANTMKAVGMLKEVLAKDSKNLNALMNLGMLSLQSGQHDKAVDRFETLMKAHPDNAEGQFYLGYSYMMAGDMQKARESFEKLKKMTKDPEILKAADQYLSEIK